MTNPRTRHLLILAAIVLLGVFWRLPSLHDAFCDPDVAGVAYSCQELLTGGDLYGDTVETKPPASYLLFAAVFAVLGRSMTYVHAVAIVWHLGVALCLLGLGRAIRDVRTGLLAAFFYAGYSTTTSVNGLCPNFESWTLLPLALMFLALWRHGGARRWWWPVLAGACAATALLFKQNVAPVVFAVPLLLAFNQSDAPPRRRLAGRVVADTALMLVGAAGPVLAVILLFWSRGQLASMWEALTPHAAVTYVSSEELGFSYQGLIENGGKFIARNVLLVGFFVWLLVFVFREKHTSALNPATQRGLRLAGYWLFSALLSVMIGTKFFGHYFILLIPPLALTGALLVSLLAFRPGRRRYVTILIVAAVVAMAIFDLRSETAQSAVAAVQLPQQGRFDKRVTDMPFLWSDDFPRTLQWNRLLEKTGICLARRTEPGDTIYVWDYEPGLYWFADRRAPTRHFMYFNVAVDLPSGAGRWHAGVGAPVTKAREELLGDLRERAPKYIVLQRRKPDDATNWHFYTQPAPPFPDLQQWIIDNYRPDYDCFNRYLVVLKQRP